MSMAKKILLVILCVLLPVAALAEEAREMPEPFASAEYTDPAQIPYPSERDENGYLLPGSAVTSYRTADEATGELETYDTEGEFVYENPTLGLWAYLSPTLQVQIVRYDGSWDGFGQRWFIADVKYDPAAERFQQHTWYVEDMTGLGLLGQLEKNGVTRGFKNQAIWPKTLAQCDRMVLAVNGDYYLDRMSNANTGNIARQGTVIRNISKGSGFPNLDCAAFFDDGSMNVYDSKETSADALVEQGARDVVSFGPWLVRDGELRDYDGMNDKQREPRLAIGMVEPGHYVIIDCEGRVPAKVGHEARGLTLNELGTLLYCSGANEAINMDGGNTSVLIFMGEKLNDTGHDTYLSKPRNQHELFGVGYSELVRTDWVNGEPK